MTQQWYILHTQTGAEERAKQALLKRKETTALKNYVSEVIVPTEQVQEVRRGKKTHHRA